MSERIDVLATIEKAGGRLVLKGAPERFMNELHEAHAAVADLIDAARGVAYPGGAPIRAMIGRHTRLRAVLERIGGAA